MRRKLGFALILAGALTLAGAGAALAAGVSMQDFSFSPRTITMSAGGSVTFTNNGDASHTATADGGAFDTGTVAPGGSGTVRIDQVGTYPYYCRFHGGPGGSGMSGTIRVLSPTETPPPQTASPLPTIATIGAVTLAAGLWLGRRRPRTG